MNNASILIILAALDSDGENTVWIQMLVLVILAACWGIWILVKPMTKKLKEQHQGHLEYGRAVNTQRRLQIQPRRRAVTYCKAVTQKFATKIQQIHFGIPKPPQEPVFAFETRGTAGGEIAKKDSAKKNKRDLVSGMELLELDFVLSIVENTKGSDKKDVIMRQLNFNELLRRRKLSLADSSALKVYAINKGKLYHKDVQCEAIKELTERTAPSYV